MDKEEYVICWKSLLLNQTVRGTRLFTEQEANRIANECNKNDKDVLIVYWAEKVNNK